MIPPGYRVAGSSYAMAGQLASVLDGLPPLASLAVLVNVDAGSAVARARDFAAGLAGGQEGLVITLLHAYPAGLEQFDGHAANAMLWTFTQQAARAWAPRRIRVNAIGLGVSVAGPFEPLEQAGRAAGPVPADPATLEDIARTTRFIATCPSLTGQIIRLGF